MFVVVYICAVEEKDVIMIITASRRTDILFFYHEWFMNRIKEGYVIVPNPFNNNQLAFLSLLPRDVTAFSFWSRYPFQIIKHLDYMDDLGYKYYFGISINNYPKKFEEFNPNVSKAIDCFKTLSNKIGKGKVIWRYDPIFFIDEVDLNFHIKNFSFIIEELSGYTKKVIISVLDNYKKTIRRFKNKNINYDQDQINHKDLDTLLFFIRDKANEHNIKVEFCAEEKDFSYTGIPRGHCVDNKILIEEFGLNVSYKKDNGQRSICGCIPARDIGVNDTCLSGCEYCYATNSHKIAEMNKKKHNPDYPVMLNFPLNEKMQKEIELFHLNKNVEQLSLF